MTISEWCPVCGANIVMVTRGIPSMGTCSNGHKTDRRDVLRRPPVDPLAQELAALRAENSRLLVDAQAAVALRDEIEKLQEDIATYQEIVRCRDADDDKRRLSIVRQTQISDYVTQLRYSAQTNRCENYMTRLNGRELDDIADLLQGLIYQSPTQGSGS